MKLSYALDQCIALKCGDNYFDLHSDYELVSALRDVERCYLHFVKRIATWVKAPDPFHVAVVFEQVTYFHLSEGLALPTSTEEIGFKELGDMDTDSWMEAPDGGPVHMLFRLEDNHFIRIGAETSFLLTSS